MSRRLSAADLYTLEIPAQPVISPDGSWIGYVLKTADRDRDENRSALWRVPAAGGVPERLTQGTADTSPAWSPDGSRLAFLRPVDGAAQVFVLPTGGGEPEQVTSLPAGAGAPVWSPDGTRIAFAAPVDTSASPDGVGATSDSRPASHPESRPIVVDRLGYKSDGAGMLHGIRTHIFVADPVSGRVQQVTSGDRHAGAPAWSPDGTLLAFPATDRDADLTGASAVYVTGPSAAVPQLRPVGGADGIAGPVRWLPTGDALLVVGRPEVTVGHNRLLRVPLDGSWTTDLTASLDRNVMPGGPGYPGGPPQVSADGRTVLFCARERGCSHVYELDLAGGGIRSVVGGASRVVSGLSVATGASRAAAVVATADSYGEVVVFDPRNGAGHALSDHSPAGVELFTAQERTFTVSDGTEVHGWLIRDPRAATPGPMLVDVHGGPHNAWSPVPDPGHAYHQMLAKRGWTVLLLNPRGSDGYGEDFFTAAVGAWGLADEHDFLEPVDQLVADGLADPGRLALSGYSYGGYMTCWLTGRTDRFAAAVTGGVVSDLGSMAGTSDMGHLLTKLETALPFEDPARCADQSPFPSVADVRTPTLILHGLADDRCPPGQAEQWFAALRARGVATRMVLYPDASHLFILDGRPSHRIDYSQRIVDWVTRHTTKESTMVASTRDNTIGNTIDRDHWQQRLAELAQKYNVPGAAVGIAYGDRTVELAYGVTNVDTGVEVTTDTMFQIGSVTKVWTATVVMALVDAGKLDLDEPVVTYLPELRLADEAVTRKVTMRHLLTHTSGIDGDFFHDSGRGDECLERYVEALADLPQNHPLEATWSYCNAGFTIAGRVIEKLTGQVWDAAMREWLYTPLGLDHTVTLPDDALLFRTAVGHVHEGAEEPRRAPVWVLPRSAGPAGLITATVADVLTFARLHLAGGVGGDGTRILSAESTAAMQAEQVRLPDPYTLAESWGLGWFRLNWDGTELYGHDGNTIGQSAVLRVLPSQDMAVVLLANGGQTRDLYETLVREIFREIAGIEMRTPLTPAERLPEVDLTPHVGTYERTSMRLDVWQAEEGPRLRITTTAELAGMEDEEPKDLDLVPVDDDLYLVRLPGEETWIPVTFYTLADGSPYVHLGARATPKAA